MFKGDTHFHYFESRQFIWTLGLLSPVEPKQVISVLCVLICKVWLGKCILKGLNDFRWPVCRMDVHSSSL